MPRGSDMTLTGFRSCAAGVKVTVLVDNSVRTSKLWGEHGLSLLVETEGRRILFDTGQSGKILIHNSMELGVNLKDVDSVVLSHAHYDHTAGLASLLGESRSINLYAHPGTFEEKYVRTEENEIKKVGIPLTKEALVTLGAKIHLDEDPIWLSDHIVLAGGIVGTTDFEDMSGEFLVKRDAHLVTDLFPDDRSMGIKTSKGLIIILGCSHVGVINTVRRIQELTETDAVQAVIGGMHMQKAGASRIHSTIQAFITLGVRNVIPLHCTGFNACAEMARLLGERFISGGVGSSFQF